MRKSVRHALGLTAVSGLLFFAALGSVDLWDEDEPTFAGAAREMLARQEWVVPYFNERMLPDKPVLSYWLMIAGYKLFGETEFAARAGSALFSVGTVLLTWLLGRRIFSPRAGAWAGLMLASSFSFLIVARAATPDAVLTFFCTLAMLAYVWSLGPGWVGAEGTATQSLVLAPIAHQSAETRDAAPHTNPKRQRGKSIALPRLRFGLISTLALAGSYAAMGMAVLAKGPIGLLLPVATIAFYSLLVAPLSNERDSDPPSGWLKTIRQWSLNGLRRFHPRRVMAAIGRMHPFIGLTIVLAVAGPWYLAVGLRTQGAWLAGFFGTHNVARFLHPMEHHRGPFFYYLLAAAIGFFPWSLFLGPTALFVRSRLRAAAMGGPAYCLLLCWVGTYLAFFSLAATKLPNYIVPIYPALALLTAAWLDAWLSAGCVVPNLLLRTAWTVLLLTGLGTSIVLPLVALHFFGEGTALTLIGLPLLAGGVLCWWWHARGQSGRAMTTFAASAIVFWLALFGFGSVEVGRHQTSRQFAEAIHRQSSKAPAVIVFGFWRPSLVYYLGRHVEPLYNLEHVRTFCGRWPEEGFLLLPDDAYPKVTAFLPHDVTIIERGPWFLKNKELLLLGRREQEETRWRTARWRTPLPR